MKRLVPYLAVVCGWLGGLMGLTMAAQADESGCDARRYTFSWSLVLDCAPQPRGGTSRGTPLSLAEDPHPGWLALQDAELDKFERDRQAILAMAGGYRTTFDFLETVGYTPDFTPDPPYQSWGTEYIYVVEDRGDFISLQHIMVMEYVDASGEIHGPVVQKHWRQDWHYEQPNLWEYVGMGEYRQRQLTVAQVKGRWAQAVYQVDDSPRYHALGQWQHQANVSNWLSETTWRPLPRRESSVRDDYQVLVGTNRHTITPTGWVQEEANRKVQLSAPGELAGPMPYLSKELGVARYERVADFDFSAGDAYWQATGPFWADVRAAWEKIFARHPRFVLADSVDGTPLFVALFQLAESVRKNSEYDAATMQPRIDALLADYIEPKQ